MIYHAYQAHSDLHVAAAHAGPGRAAGADRAATCPADDIGAAQARRGLRSVRARRADASSARRSGIDDRRRSATATIAVARGGRPRTRRSRTLLHFRKDVRRPAARAC